MKLTPKKKPKPIKLHVVGTPTEQVCSLQNFLWAHAHALNDADEARLGALKKGTKCRIRLVSWHAGRWRNGERIHREVETTLEIERV